MKDKAAASLILLILCAPPLGGCAMRSIERADLLQAPFPAAARSKERPIEVLFVCQYGYAKSLVSALYFQRAARAAGLSTHIRVRGITPEEHVPAALVENLRRESFDVARFRPTKLRRGTLSRADVVISYGVPLPPPGRGAEQFVLTSPSLTEDFEGARASLERDAQMLAEYLGSSRRTP